MILCICVLHFDTLSTLTILGISQSRHGCGEMPDTPLVRVHPSSKHHSPVTPPRTTAWLLIGGNHLGTRTDAQLRMSALSGADIRDGSRKFQNISPISALCGRHR